MASYGIHGSSCGYDSNINMNPAFWTENLWLTTARLLASNSIFRVLWNMIESIVSSVSIRTSLSRLIDTLIFRMNNFECYPSNSLCRRRSIHELVGKSHTKRQQIHYLSLRNGRFIAINSIFIPWLQNQWNVLSSVTSTFSIESKCGNSLSFDSLNRHHPYLYCTHERFAADWWKSFDWKICRSEERCRLIVIPFDTSHQSIRAHQLFTASPSILTHFGVGWEWRFRKSIDSYGSSGVYFRAKISNTWNVEK